MLDVPCWEFGECLELLKEHFNRTDLTDDLDPEAERQLCQLANERTGTAAVFVLGFPLLARPFYSAPRGSNGAASSFDLLFEGIEITTGGQRLHHREDLEAALRGRGIEPTNFENHLRMFDERDVMQCAMEYPDPVCRATSCRKSSAVSFTR